MNYFYLVSKPVTGIFFIFFLTNTCLLAQKDKVIYHPNSKITPVKLKQDFQTMRQALEELHPSLYWYTSKDTLDAAFDQTFASLTQPLNEQEFINVLYPLISKIRCGHTQLGHSNAYKASPERPKLIHLPFDVFVQKGRAWLTTNHTTDTTLKTGMELLSINGISTRQLIQDGRNTWSSDGYNLTWKEFFLNEYDFFEDVCWKIYQWKEPYLLEVIDQYGKTRSTSVTLKPTFTTPAPAKDTMAILQSGGMYQRADLYFQLMEEVSTAHLTVNSLEYGDEQFYQDAFQKIEQKQVKNLILDVRRNHGGDIRIISKLLSYLADSNFVILQRLFAKKANPAVNQFAAYFNADRTRSHNLGYGTGKKSGNFYTIPCKPAMGNIAGLLPISEKYRFGGNVYVLIDGGTFSSAAIFTAALKTQCQKAVFIGRETGGGETGCGGGTNQEFTLPHSKLVLQFPWMRMVSASKNPTDGYGLQPDFPVTYTAKTIADKRDLDIEKAMELVRSKIEK